MCRLGSSLECALRLQLRFLLRPRGLNLDPLHERIGGEVCGLGTRAGAFDDLRCEECKRDSTAQERLAHSFGFGDLLEGGDPARRDGLHPAARSRDEPEQREVRTAGGFTRAAARHDQLLLDTAPANTSRQGKSEALELPRQSRRHPISIETPSFVRSTRSTRLEGSCMPERACSMSVGNRFRETVPIGRAVQAAQVCGRAPGPPARRFALSRVQGVARATSTHPQTKSTPLRPSRVATRSSDIAAPISRCGSG